MTTPTVAIVQARMGSTRLPGKVLAPVLGEPLLGHMMERVLLARNLDRVVVATTEESADDPIADYCRTRGYSLFRGDEGDVLDRYHRAAEQANASTIVRLTADCPLIDPQVIDRVVSVYKDGTYDYVANTAPPPATYPDGMDLEVFSRASLVKAWQEAKRPSDREHVTFYFWQNPQMFRTYRVDHDPDLSSYRLTVDYPEDLQLVRAMLEALLPGSPAFTMGDVIEHMQTHPELIRLNDQITPNQGWEPSFQRDREEGY